MCYATSGAHLCRTGLDPVFQGLPARLGSAALLSSRQGPLDWKDCFKLQIPLLPGLLQALVSLDDQAARVCET